MLDVFRPLPKAEAHGGQTMWSDVELGFHIFPGHEAYIEWPESEPMQNVLALIAQAERGGEGEYRVVFDVDDDGLWEVLAGGYRLHGIFVDQIIN